MSKHICLSSPDVTEAEELALVRAIRSGWVAPLGPEVDAFEAELAAYAGRAHSVALSSGTAALHLGLLVLGVGPGDLVVTSTMTFAATANAIVYTGAEPVFVDCDETGNLDASLLTTALSDEVTFGRRVAAIVPVDLFGKVADHARIGALAAERAVPVLSDAAESFGAVRDGVSSAAYGHAAAVSFNGNKIMTTSGGGALFTDDVRLATRVRHLATQAKQPTVHYEHTEVGYNYRMSNILAALGRAQLARLEQMIEQRRRHRQWYRDLFAGVPGISLFGEPSGVDGGETRDNFWLTSVLVDPAVAGFTSEDLRVALATSDIESRPMWKPLHLQPVFSGTRAVVNGTSERLFSTGLCLPSGSALGEADMRRIARVIQSFARASRVAG